MKKEPSVTKNSVNSGICTELVNKIFLKFSIFYGHIWRSQFKNDYFTEFARNEWYQALLNTEEKLIDQAIEECLKSREMPPSLSQFLECCRNQRRKLCFYTEGHVQGNPKIAQDELEKIKEKLNMKRR